jgi:hypothetical protein
VPAQIAQLLVPSDGLAAPQAAVVDWVNHRAFLTSTTSLRSYSLAFATQSPIASAAIGFTFACLSDADPVSGNLILANGGGVLTQYDPLTLTAGATYNTGIVIDAAICCGCGTVASGGAVQRGYAAIKQSVFSGRVDVIFTDTMTTAGAVLDVVSGSVDNRGTLWRGASGPAGGSIFARGDNYAGIDQATLPIWRIDILPGAENFAAANPFISVHTVGELAASAIDPAWTTFAIQQAGYDRTDGNLLFEVSSDDGTTHRYVIKADAATLAVIWAVPLFAAASALAGYNVTRSRAMFLPTGTLDIIATDIGALTTTALAGIASNTAVMSDDVAGLILLHTTYTAGVGAPVAVTGTPSSFTGWSLLAPVVVNAPDYAVTVDEDCRLDAAVVATITSDTPLTYTVLDAPTHGFLTLNADGTYEYRPARAYWGLDGFTYRAADAVSGVYDDGTVTIDVIQAFPLTGVVKVLLPPAELQFCDANGLPYAGGSLEFYEPGTSNPKDTWRSPTGDADTLNENPLILDAAGRALIYGDGAYRTVLRDADGTLIWDQPSFTYVSSCMVPVVGAADLATARQAMGITDAIEAEALLRIAADDAERTAREAADTALGARIDAETAARIAADNALGARIDGLPAPNPPLSAIGGEAALDPAGHCRVTFGTPFATACTSFVVTGAAVGVWSGAFNIANQDRFGCDVWGSIFGSRTPAANVAFFWLAVGN